MKDILMNKTDWRTVQIYLSASGIFEVEIDLESDDVRCNCPGFAARGNCRHTRKVVIRARANGGVYPMQVSSRATNSETKIANGTPETFREFVVKYGKIEVI